MLVIDFIFIHALCMRVASALASLRFYIGLLEHSLLDNAIRATFHKWAQMYSKTLKILLSIFQNTRIFGIYFRHSGFREYYLFMIYFNNCVLDA